MQKNPMAMAVATITDTVLDQSYQPGPEALYISPVEKNRFNFIKQVQNSFVNKMVSMTFPDFNHCFEFSVYEAIINDTMQIVASSSQFYIKAMIHNDAPEGFKKFIERTRPVSIHQEMNLSAQIIRQSVYNISKGLAPVIEFIHVNSDSRLHPRIKSLMPKTMRYAVGAPLFVKGQPIGILWGIYRKTINEEQKKDIRNQVHALIKAIDILISEELDSDQDAYMARRKIEKFDTTSNLEGIFYTRVFRQPEPVKSMVLYSNRYEEKYRQDTNYIIPTINGFSVSLKRFLPEQMNGQDRIILMIPGFFCNRSLMDRLAKEMALEYGYTVFTMDMRGRSKYTMPRKLFNSFKWTVDDYIWEDLPITLNWIKEMHPGKKVIIFGHSMGGMVPLFYASAYDKYGKERAGDHAIKPESIIEGIVSITSPMHIRLGAESSWFQLFKASLKFLNGNILTEPMMKILNYTLTTTVGSIDLNKFFTFLHNISSSVRMFSFDVGYKWPTLKDFVGYEQITPPEWYFLMEDVFCEESVMVIGQFLRSLIDGENFTSFDKKINYTAELKNLDIPHFTIVGTIDEIAPPETVRQGYEFSRSPKNKISEFKQGHLGIISHPETIKKIAVEADDWIRAMPKNYVS